MGNLIPSLQNAILSASCNTSADAGFWSLSLNGIYATPNWVLKSINLSAYLGSCVTVEVLAVGCIYTGHEGYMYYDALCSSSSTPPGLNVMYANSMVAASYSTCAQPVVLSSVNGMTAYNWQGPSGSGVSNSTLTQVTASISGVYSLSAFSGTTAYTQTLAVTIHSLPTLSIIGPTIYCGTSTVSVQVVTSASSFSWGNGSTATMVVIGPSLSVQSYINAYSAAGCSLNVPFYIQANYPSFNTVVASKTLVCLGQSLSLTSQHSGVSLLWSNGSTSNSFVITPTVSSLYTASVNSTGGCISRDSVYITVAPNPTIQVSITNTALCQFKSLFLTANASPQCTINWNTGDIGSTTFPFMFQSTTITAKATNVFGCTTTAICDVTVYPRPEYTLVPPSQTMCEGDPVSFSVTNVSIPASYYWSTGSTSSVTTISPSTGVTVATTLTSSQGCSNSKYIQYTPKPRNAMLSILEDSKIICLGQSVYFNANAYNILAMGWSTGDSTATIYVTPTISTTYSLIGQDIYGCKYQDSRIVTVDPCADLTEHSVNSALWIFPNPSREIFEVRSNSQQDIKLFDAQAKLVFSTTLTADNKYRALIDNLPTGIYFLKTNNETFKLLKMQ